MRKSAQQHYIVRQGEIKKIKITITYKQRFQKLLDLKQMKYKENKKWHESWHKYNIIQLKFKYIRQHF